MGEVTYDSVIIGGGPAGLSAGIYAARAGLRATILDKGMCGGMAATSPWIENYPGFKGISGWDLMEKMREHAKANLKIITGADIDSVSKSGNGFKVRAGEKTYDCLSVIFATGTEHRKLGVPGEAELTGKGVSYCATCDGTFFKEKRVAVVGGGNNGATEALHLKHIGCDVTLIHRRDTLRAEQYIQDQLASQGINMVLSSTVEKIIGDSKVESIEVKSCIDGTAKTLEFDGVFVSIGEEPNTMLAKQLGVKLNKYGYIEADRTMRTSMRMVYAAGDVSGGLRQVVTACAEGAVAAMSAYEDIKMPYWV